MKRLEIANWLNNIGDDSLGYIQSISAKKGVISLAGGIPDPSLFPNNLFKSSLEKVYGGDTRVLHSYTDAFGYQPLREWIALNGVDLQVEATNICITNGAQQAIDIICKVMLDKNDIIITENPSYLGAINIFKSYNARIVGIPIDDEGMIAEDLEIFLKENKPKFLYTVPNGHNPTGITMSYERRRKIVDICKNYNVLIIEDDPYRSLNYSNTSFPTLYSISNTDNVIYLGSFSKILSPGLRLGWIITPLKYKKPIQIVKQNTDLMTNLIVQKALSKFLESFPLDSYILNTISVYQKKMNFMSDKLNQIPNISYKKPNHGLFIWAKIKDSKLDIFELSQSCNNKNVCFVPGPYFFLNEEREPYIRLNFSVPTIQQIDIGIDIIESEINKSGKKNLVVK